MRRGDYLLNWIVQITRTVLWFNPAVSRFAVAVDDAREESCDVEAVAHEASPVALARALVRLAERPGNGNPAQLGSLSGGVLARVQRLLGLAALHSRSVATEPKLGACIPLVLNGFIVVAGVAFMWRVTPASDRLAITGAEAGVLRIERNLIHAFDPAGAFTLTLVNGRVAAVTIANQSIDRSAIRVEGSELRVASPNSGAGLHVRFDPRGTISWTARPRLQFTTHLRDQ